MTPDDPGRTGYGTRWHACINDAWGVDEKPAPAGRNDDARCMSEGGIDAGGPGGWEPPRRLSGGRCGRSRRQAVRSTLPKAMAAPPAPVPALLHGAVRRLVSGEAGTGDARGAAGTSRGDARCRRSRPGRARRGRRRAWRAAPARGVDGGPTDDAVEHGNQRVVPATAVSAASRRASGARSERSERRREGYPPDGPRPRSGLGRVARSRSDAPSLIDCIGEPVSIIGTLITVIACTIGICTTITETGMGIIGIVVTIGFTSIGIMGAGTIIVLGAGSGVCVERCAVRFKSGRRA